MGSLVFQATLGGQVNLNGPNTASTFDIAVPATTGTMVTTGDSGTVTNTMLAASAYNTPGTIGSGTANSGAFTTLSASSTVSGTGFSTYLASPPAIGGTTAASGRFSSLTNTGLTSGRVVYSTTSGLETDSANLTFNGTTLTAAGLAGPLNGTVGATTPSTASFTSLAYSTTLTGGTGIVNLGSGQFYKDASGNVGIGTTSPAVRLQVSNAFETRIFSTNSVSAITVEMGAETDTAYAGSFTNHPYVIRTNDAERMRIDSSGNVGIGTSSPPAMSGNGLQAGASSIFECVAVSQTLISNNAYFNPSLGWKAVRTQNGYAAIRQNAIAAGVTSFHQNSASYTAGDTLTNIDSTDIRMVIDSSGNVGIGTSSPGSFKLSVNGTASGLLTRVTDGVAQSYDVGTTSTGVYFNTPNTGYYAWQTNSTERMRIDSSGNVGIGTSSPNASAILDAQSTTKGVRMPNMTTTQKNAISSPAAGLMVFDTTLAKLCVYSGSAWQTITSI